MPKANSKATQAYRRQPIPKRGLGTSHQARLRYCQEFSLDAAASGISSFVVRANDLYQPPVAASDHQPYTFDQLMAFFDHFTVTSSNIKVQFVRSGTADVVPSWCGVLLSDAGTSATASSSVSHLLERRGGDGVLVGGFVGAPTGAQVATTMKASFDAKKFFRKDNIIGDSLYRGSKTASPSEMAYFEVFAASISDNNPGSVQGLITIDYTATFTEPTSIAQS